MTGSKTTVYTSQIQQVTEKGFLDPEDNEHEVDVIICATGFDTSYNVQFPRLVNGEDKGQIWSKTGQVASYLSLAYAEVPNYLVFLGGYGPIAHGSNIPIIEAYTDYAVQLLSKIQVERIRSVRPKAKPTQHFLGHAKEYLKKTAWTGPCSSWFKGGKKTGTPVRPLLLGLFHPGLIRQPRLSLLEVASHS